MHAKCKSRVFPSSHGSSFNLFKACLVLILIILLVSFFETKNTLSNQNTSVVEKKETKHTGTATSGSLFTGEKMRTFPRDQVQFANYHLQTQPKKLQSWTHQRPCSKWSVTTTIFEVSEAMKIQTRLSED